MSRDKRLCQGTMFDSFISELITNTYGSAVCKALKLFSAVFRSSVTTIVAIDSACAFFQLFSTDNVSCTFYYGKWCFSVFLGYWSGVSDDY